MSHRTPVRLMARPPQFARDDDAPSLAAVKSTIKQLRPEDRATLLAWLSLYYADDGLLFSPQITKKRDRVTIGGKDFWLVRIPTK
jgi:hypothetical protein